MYIWAACSWKMGERDPEDDTLWPADPIDSYWVNEDLARAAAEDKFREWAAAEQAKDSSIQPRLMLWAPSRSYPDRRSCIWVAYSSAAPSMDDEDRSFYPQLREASFWVSRITVGGAPE